MLITLIIVTSLICSSFSLHLNHHQANTAVTTTSLRLITNSAIANLTALNTSLAATVLALNPYNQDDRFAKLQTAINQARQTLISIYIRSSLPLNRSNYYCQQIPPNQLTDITTSLTNINQALTTASQTPPFNDPNNPNKQTSAQANGTVNWMKQILPQTGTATAAAPIQIMQSNIAGGQNWSLGGSTLPNIAGGYTVGNYQNGELCPAGQPFATGTNQCIACSGYFDLTAKVCLPCNNFDTTKRICLDGTVQPPTPVQPTQPTTPTQPVQPAQPIQRVTNTQNPTGLLLPSTQNLADYISSLTSKGPNVVPCPTATPYFDGTKCITCPSGQYFSVTISTCQTCPAGYIYTPTTYHCDPITFYSAIATNNQWLTIAKNPAQIQTLLAQSAATPNSQPCPSSTPFFNGKTCIACTQPTPYFSFDSTQCSSCIPGTVFSSNLHTCLVAQRGQTNLNSPNLLLDGHPLNEWKSYYFSNQTADPQLADCPAARPYFDGIVCVACAAPNTLFSLQNRVCTSCKAGTAYDAGVRECLSSSGNIVTQSPSLAKMAAGIFA